MVSWISGANALASELPEVKTITQTIKLYQGVLSYPPPMRMSRVKDLGNSKFFRDQQRNLFTLEQIPKAQEFENWTQLYGAYGFYLPEYDMKRFVDESLNALALGCKEQTKSKVVSAQNVQNHYDLLLQRSRRSFRQGWLQHRERFPLHEPGRAIICQSLYGLGGKKRSHEN
ncbi:protein of unknown function [Pseudodesulfovibrio piezophilus C1TLV30]|uniref:Uncharacterized protein n=1 Tax=Pseudodesulfovibrio piezophilus (strain DSM 21447 / JCM 15486 / C1TLV30) TaxID=1322246 RepID=M1WRN0_PSEP2|nr:protein of unknown function [Pseudodesulfovibrio piezophilus C1TLV30]